MEENENSTPNGEITQEAIDALKAELEAEKAKTTEAVTQATQDLNDRIASLETDLSGASGQLEAAVAQVASLSGELETAKTGHDAAVTAFREHVLASNPLLPADIVHGNTVDEIKSSMDKANALIGHIKQGLEAQQGAQQEQNTVPAGAPGRTPTDTSAMTTREKINYGLNQVRSKIS